MPFILIYIYIQSIYKAYSWLSLFFLKFCRFSHTSTSVLYRIDLFHLWKVTLISILCFLVCNTCVRIGGGWQVRSYRTYMPCVLYMYANSVRIVSATLVQRKVKIFLNAPMEQKKIDICVCDAGSKILPKWKNIPACKSCVINDIYTDHQRFFLCGLAGGWNIYRQCLMLVCSWCGTSS